ncbi:hypothetical protein A6A08_15175 [Nocardiopsis sp. TSRI0078]|nr:hypothetical protein A6A08_15175 [Nocardiopsis sp. TSRI0078]
MLPDRAGPVMVMGRGVAGLDGATGQELWHYRVEDGGVRRVWTTPGGQDVLLGVPGGEDEPDTMVLLDAGTGELIAEHDTDLEGGTVHTAAVTSHVGVLVSQERDMVEGFSLRDGEHAWTYELPDRAGSAGVAHEEVVRAGETVVVMATYYDHTLEDESVRQYDQVMFAAALDGETGEPLWELEQEFAYDMLLDVESEVSPSKEALFLGVRAGAEYDLLVDPATGGEIGGAAYQDRERYPVGLLDDGYVETAVDYDEGTVGYWHMSFEGEELACLETRSRPGEDGIGRGLLLEEGVLRPDHLTGPDLDRGPVDVEFARWNSEDEPLVLNADMTVNEEWWFESEGSVTTLPDSPVLALVPGAVVVTEENPGPWTVVGLT